MDAIARRTFSGLSEKFIHGTGHGFGVQIHEKPNLAPRSKDILKPNTVFTVEPGYYDAKQSIGIRIEDDVLLTNKGKVVLTKVTKELICF